MYHRVFVSYPDHLSLGGEVGGAVAEAQSRLQRVEYCLQLGLLLQLGRLVLAAVVTELLQLALRARKRVVGRAVLQPRRRASDPLEQLKRKQVTS